MLFIILLALIGKLAVVSARCEIGTINLSHTNGTKFTGTWYWLYHSPLKYNENLDCPVSTIEPITNNLARATTSVYVKRTQTRDRYVGTLLDWNTHGYPYFDVCYPKPTRDTNCSANESCSKNPSYARIWSGRYHVLSVDHGRYVIYKYCGDKFDKLTTYVAFRTPNPDAETLDELKKDLRRNGVNFNQLAKWKNKHC